MFIIALCRLGLHGGLLGLALLLLPPVPASVAQSVPVLGYVAAKHANPKRLEAFRQGLLELGYVEGRSLKIVYREAVLDSEYHAAMAELVASKVTIILAANIAAAVAAAKATTSIPIVMLAVNDPVGVVTGTTMYAPQLIGERLRILARRAPGLDRISMILNGNNANNATQLELARTQARGLGIEVQSLDILKPEDVEPAFDKAGAFGAKAFVNAVDSFVNSQRFALAAGAAKRKLPAFYTDVEYVAAGGLMGLGPGHYEGYHGAAGYVDKVLHGANPADLPVAGATQFAFSVNRPALARLGLSLPPDISARVNDWLD